MGVPVDARYFPRGGVRDAELDAMEVEVFWEFMYVSATATFRWVIR